MYVYSTNVQKENIRTQRVLSGRRKKRGNGIWKLRKEKEDSGKGRKSEI